MKVWVLTDLDLLDCSEVLGVFSALESAQQHAERLADKHFDWFKQSDHTYTNTTVDLSDSYYYVKEFEVQP